MLTDVFATQLQKLEWEIADDGDTARKPFSTALNEEFHVSLDWREDGGRTILRLLTNCPFLLPSGHKANALCCHINSLISGPHWVLYPDPDGERKVVPILEYAWDATGSPENAADQADLLAEDHWDAFRRSSPAFFRLYHRPRTPLAQLRNYHLLDAVGEG